MIGPLTIKQDQIIRAYNRDQPQHLILHGAVRSGKTYLNNLLWVSHVYNMPKPRKDFLVTGYTIGSIERNVIMPLSEVLGRSITLDQFGRFDMGYHKVNCFGTDNQMSYKPMQGMTGYGWLGNELSVHHRNSVIEAFQRCSGAGTRIFWDTNPDHPFHYIKTDYIDKGDLKDANGKLLLRSVHFALTDNETLSVEYLEQIKRSTPKGMWYDRRIKGLWVAAEGIIYEGFDREANTCEPFIIPDGWQRVRGIDFGTVHPFVMLWGAIDPDGRLFIYREYYKTHTLIKNHAEKIKELSEKERYLWTVSDHDAQERLEYEAHDIMTRPAQKSVKLGLDLTAQRMVKQVDGRPRLIIFRTCPELIRQLGVYSWLPYEEGKPYREEPLKVDDDGPDVLRYMVMELDYNTMPIIEAGFRGYTPRG